MDLWSVQENLVLAHAVIKNGENNWSSVSRAIRHHVTQERVTGISTEFQAPEKYTAKRCASAYAKLLENEPKQKRSSTFGGVEKSSQSPKSVKRDFSPRMKQSVLISNKLKDSRVKELTLSLKVHEKNITELIALLAQIKSGKMDAQIQEMSSMPPSDIVSKLLPQHLQFYGTRPAYRVAAVASPPPKDSSAISESKAKAAATADPAATATTGSTDTAMKDTAKEEDVVMEESASGTPLMRKRKVGRPSKKTGVKAKKEFTSAPSNVAEETEDSAAEKEEATTPTNTRRPKRDSKSNTSSPSLAESQELKKSTESKSAAIQPEPSSTGKGKSGTTTYSKKAKKGKAQTPTSTPSSKRKSTDMPLPSTPEQRSELEKALLEVWKSIYHHKSAPMFHHPVTEMEAPGYGSIIKQSMDLFTIHQKLNNGQYSSVHEFNLDLMLMFANALFFNSEDSVYYQMAAEVKATAQELMKPLLELFGAQTKEASRMVGKKRKRGQSPAASKAKTPSSAPPTKKQHSKAKSDTKVTQTPPVKRGRGRPPRPK